jgi:hypothetical protein
MSSICLITASVRLSDAPQSFLPDEDQGAIFAAVRLPEGVCLNSKAAAASVPATTTTLTIATRANRRTIAT